MRARFFVDVCPARIRWFGAFTTRPVSSTRTRSTKEIPTHVCIYVHTFCDQTNPPISVRSTKEIPTHVCMYIHFASKPIHPFPSGQQRRSLHMYVYIHFMSYFFYITRELQGSPLVPTFKNILLFFLFNHIAIFFKKSPCNRPTDLTLIINHR